MQKEKELQLNLVDVHLGFGEPLLIPQNIQYRQKRKLQGKSQNSEKELANNA